MNELNELNINIIMKIQVTSKGSDSKGYLAIMYNRMNE